MKIGELASRANMPASTLRYYEKVGVLARPQRVNGQRVYPPDALKRLKVVRIAQGLGFTLAEIKLLME